MTQELSYRAETAAGYDRAFGSIAGQFIPGLLRAARVSPHHRVLDVATGTGVPPKLRSRPSGRPAPLSQPTFRRRCSRRHVGVSARS
jgi:hypothetical protein